MQNDRHSFRRFHVETVTEPLTDGQSRQREVIRHPGAVVVLPWVDETHICLIRNYRIAVEQTLIELPAGTCEPNEPKDVTAIRELKEETGYTAATIDLMASFYAAPGVMDERMHFFVARELTAGQPALESGEQITNLIVPWKEAIEMVHAGEICDAKTICGLLLWANRHGQP